MFFGISYIKSIFLDWWRFSHCFNQLLTVSYHIIFYKLLVIRLSCSSLSLLLFKDNPCSKSSFSELQSKALLGICGKKLGFCPANCYSKCLDLYNPMLKCLLIKKKLFVQYLIINKQHVLKSIPIEIIKLYL